jgi:tetratricopeptide (TPR) repeat protein
MKKGLAQYKNGNFIDTIKAYKHASNIEPKNAKPHYQLGQTFEKMKQEKKAISSYLQAIDLNEKHTKSYNCLGAIHEKNNQFDEAAQFYRQAAYWGDVSAKQWGLEHGFHWL